MKKPTQSPDTDTSFVYEGKIKVYTYYGGEKPSEIDYYDNVTQAVLQSQGAEHYEMECMNVEIVKCMLKDMLNWSDRIGSDEIMEIRHALNLLKKIYL